MYGHAYKGLGGRQLLQKPWLEAVERLQDGEFESLCRSHSRYVWPCMMRLYVWPCILRIMGAATCEAQDKRPHSTQLAWMILPAACLTVAASQFRGGSTQATAGSLPPGMGAAAWRRPGRVDACSEEATAVKPPQRRSHRAGQASYSVQPAKAAQENSAGTKCRKRPRWAASLGTEGGTRTRTTLRSHAPETCASTNSATSVKGSFHPQGPQI
jgi:hypothetical protein